MKAPYSQISKKKLKNPTQLSNFWFTANSTITQLLTTTMHCCGVLCTNEPYHRRSYHTRTVNSYNLAGPVACCLPIYNTIPALHPSLHHSDPRSVYQSVLTNQLTQLSLPHHIQDYSGIKYQCA